MEDNTWVKLYRKLLKSPIFDNEKALKVWVWCLLKATHVDREQLVGRQTVHLKKGEFIFGRKKASQELKMKEKTLYDYMKLLENLQMLVIKSNNKFSVVSIEKWENYQEKKIISDNKRTTNEQQMNTNKNVKNVNNNIYKEIENFTNNEKLIESITEFIDYRKSKKKELTDLALKKILNKFKEWQYTEEECIESINNSIMNGWTGVFELKDRKPKQTKQDYIEIDVDKLTQEQYTQYLKGQLTKEDLIKIMEEKNV